MQWHARVWWNWAIPVLGQIPLGVVLAIGSRYYLEEGRKRKLRKAFGFYLSPDLADEIAERMELNVNGARTELLFEL